MYTLNSNIAALNARNTSRMQTDDLQKSLRRLSSGLRINSSADDVGGIVVANNLRAQESSTGEALKNVNNAIGMFQIMDKAIDQQLKILDTIKAKAIQAATDGQSQQVRDALQQEVKELIEELDNIARNTSYNNTKLLDGTFVDSKIQIGAFANDLLEFSINSSDSSKMGHVSYQTTYGGSRDVSNLQLNFKNAGHGGEDVKISPFHLSHTAGKSIKDLAALVNKSTEDTGIRAVYREGSPPLSHELNAIARSTIGTRSIEDSKNSDLKKINIPSLNVLEAKELLYKEQKIEDNSDLKKINIPSLNLLEPKELLFKEQKIEDIGILKPNIDTSDISYPLSFRAISPKVLFPIGNKIYEDVSNSSAGTFQSSSIRIALVDEEFDPLISGKIQASVGGKPITASFQRLDSRTIEMKIPNGLPSTVVSDTDKPARVNLVFDAGILVSREQLEPSFAVLEYSSNPSSKLSIIGSLTEASTNSGNVNGKVTVEIQGDTFVGAASTADLGTFTVSAGSPFSITNQSVALATSRKIVYNITGIAATSHGALDDYSLTLANFNSTNATTAGTPPTNVTSLRAIVDMLDSPSVDIDRNFKESSDNDGYVATSIVLKLAGDKFNKDLTSSQIANIVKIVNGGNTPVTAIRPDLQLVYTVNNDNELTVSFRQRAQAHNTDLTGLRLDLSGASSLFKNGLVPELADINNSVLFDIEFLQAPTFTVNPLKGFAESSSNNGSVADSVLLTMPATGNTFAADVKNFIDVVNLPDGLTPRYVRVNNKNLRVFLDGEATSKTKGSIEGFGFGFRKNAFTQPVGASVNVPLSFVDAPKVNVTGIFSEDLATNDGTISSTITLTLDATFDTAAVTTAGQDISAFFNATGLPGNITPSYKVINVNDQTVEMSLAGKYNPHNQDVSNISVNALGTLFQSRVGSTPATDISIDFLSEPSARATGFVKESLANDGTVNSRVTITLTNDELVTTVTDTQLNAAANTGAYITNVPNGLVPSFHKLDDNTIELSFNGVANPHYSYSIDSALSINFNSNILQASSDNITTTVPAKFNDPTPVVSIAYGSFIESSKNDGSVESTVALKIPSGVSLKDSVKQEFLDNPVVATRKYIKTYDLPYILSPVVTIDQDHPELLIVNLSGNALTHGDDDSGAFKIRLQPAMFNDDAVVSDVDIDLVLYDQPRLHVFGSFRESEFNDGSITGELNINVLGTNLNNITVADHITVTGVPTGLYPVFSKSENSIIMKLDGNAQNHGEFDDVYDINLAFANTLFENGMNVSDIRNIGINFRDALELKVSDSFVESGLNDGSITSSITIRAENDKISSDLPDSLDNLITIKDLPLGLTPVYERLNKKELKISLAGKAYIHEGGQGDTINISFDKDVFESGIKPADIEELPINFKNAPSIKAVGSFEENAADDGGVDGALTFEMQNDVFNELINYSPHIVVYNLPAGLTPKYELSDNNHLIMTLEGKALSNGNANDVDDLSVQFAGKVASKGVAPSNIVESLSIDFKDAPKIYPSTFFKESSENDATIGNSVDLNLYGGRFSSVNPNDYITVTNVPSGLEPFFTRVSNSKINMRLIGTATDGTAFNDVNNMIIQYKPELFVNKVAAVDTEEVYIDFKNRPTIIPKGSLIESSFNDGTFEDTLTLQVSGDTLNDVSDADLNSLARLESLPAGLTAVFKKLSDIEVELSFKGAARVHNNSIIRPTLIMGEALFKNELSPLKLELTNVSFVDDPIIEVSNHFIESTNNDGSIDNTISLSVNGASFGNVDFNKNIVVSNLPAGLTPVFVKRSESVLEMSLDGNSIEHTNKFDSNDVKLDFSASVFKNGIHASALEGVSINFREKPSLDTNSFVESELNDGSIGTAVTLTITEDVDAFLDVDLNALITATNVPIGLTPRFTRLDDKNVKMTLEGKALKHANFDDALNVSLNFNSSAFLSGLKANDIINMVVDFRDPLVPIFEAEDDIFKEHKNNDGSIDTVVDLVLKGEDELAIGVTDANVGDYIKVDPKTLPSGLTASFKVVTNKLVQMSLNGKANDHLDKHDTPLKLTFDAMLFKRNIQGKDLNSLNIDFKDPLISFEGNFKEKLIDDGSTDSKVTINLFGDEYTNVNLEDNITVGRLPLGLTPSYRKINNTQIEMSLLGNAVEHTNDFDVDNLNIKLGINTIKSKTIVYEPNQRVGIDFSDPPPAIQKAGGPGLYGGYLTFISENARELVISAGTNQSNFGLNNQFRTTLNLKDILLTKFNKEELFATGIEKSPNVLTQKNSSIFGLSNKHSSLVMMDAVDSASKYLRDLRSKIASLQGRLQLTSNRLLVEKQNLKSAESNIREIDFAEETTKFQKRSLLAQAGNYMLSQANISQKMVLDLLKF